jgi:hypothetical protein
MKKEKKKFIYIIETLIPGMELWLFSSYCILLSRRVRLLQLTEAAQKSGQLQEAVDAIHEPQVHHSDLLHGR